MEIISHEDAKARGLARYYSGKKCLQGHMVERHTDSRRCVECPQTDASCKKAAKTKPAAVTPRVNTSALTRHDCPQCGPNVLFVGFTCLHCKTPLGGKPKRSSKPKPLWRDYHTVPA